MGQVNASINGRTYRLSCRDGEEERVGELIAYVSRKVDGLVSEFGQVGEARLLTLAALLIADELFDQREAAANAGAIVAPAASNPVAPKPAASTPEEPVVAGRDSGRGAAGLGVGRGDQAAAPEPDAKSGKAPAAGDCASPTEIGSELSEDGSDSRG